MSIRVNDDGVDATLPDFSSKFDVASSCPIYLPLNITKDGHGTTCAAIAVGSPNDSCSVGIAPDAKLSGCRVLGDDSYSSENGEQFYAPSGGSMDVSSNSYGIDACTEIAADRRAGRATRHLQASACPFSATATDSPCLATSMCATAIWNSPSSLSVACKQEITDYCSSDFENDVSGCIDFLDLFVESCEYNTLHEDDQAGITKGITEGRNGKGIIYVFAAGNEFGIGEVVNFEGALNSRFTIAVGAVGKLGKHASYSSTGVALFISAPGGDHEFSTNHVVAKAGGGCGDAGFGTSFATPVVSGVAALLLQANPDLGWRDVQGIFATTSQKTDPTDPSWITNAVGLHHSTKYGFGLVDADAAVTAAKTWQNYPPEMQVLVESGLVALSIGDFPASAVSSTVSINEADNIIVESVVAYLDLSHSRRGDLDIILTSPSGTSSLLVPGKRPESTQADDNWKLMTVRAWGENAAGVWTLSFTDQKTDLTADTIQEVLNSWKLVVYGRTGVAIVAPEPPTEPPTDIGGGFCFSGSCLAQTQDRGFITIDQLRIGDLVHVGNGLFERVYSFGHYKEDQIAEFFKVNGGLEISPDHMLFVKARGFTPTSNLVVGDLLVDGRGNEVIVKTIQLVKSMGVYAPFTLSGKIAVNNVLASSFIAFENKPSVELYGAIFSFQWLAHMFEFPHRVACHYLASCPRESYTEEGVSQWVATPHRVGKWLLLQNEPEARTTTTAKQALLALFVGVLAIFYGIEVVFTSPPATVVLAALALLLFGMKKKSVAA